MTPVFLVVSGRLDDTNDLLQQILSYLQESIFPLLYEIRDAVAGQSVPVSESESWDSPLIVVLLMAVGFLCGIQLFRVFAARIRG